MERENSSILKPGRHVQIADNDPEDLGLFREALAEPGENITLTETNNGAQLLEQLSIEIPDLVFLDINMPRMNGIDCLASIRKLEHLKVIPVIMYSTAAHDAYIAKTFELGANRYIQKPASFEMIKTHVEEILHLPPAELFSPQYPGSFNQAAVLNCPAKNAYPLPIMTLPPDVNK